MSDAAAIAGIAFIVGIVFFSGSLYALIARRPALARADHAAGRTRVHRRLGVVCVERLAQLTESRVYIRRQGRMTRGSGARAARRCSSAIEFRCLPNPLIGSPISVGTRRWPLEIGFGMGHALLETAQRHPEWNCLGVEVYRPGIGALLNAVEAAQLQNVRVIEGDARAVLANMIDRGDAASRHGVLSRPLAQVQTSQAPPHQRRVRRVGRAAARRRTVNCSLATDWEHYADAMRVVLDAEPRLENLAGDGQFATRNEERPTTRFEARGVRLGHQVWDLAYRKREFR